MVGGSLSVPGPWSGPARIPVEEAIRKAVAEGVKTSDHLAWFEVKEIRGRIDKGQVVDYQVSLRLGYKLD